MPAQTTEGTGQGIGEKNPGLKIVASGYVVGSGTVNVLLPYPLKNGIDKYNVIVTSENPLPADGDNDANGQPHSFNVSKLDDRFELSESDWVFTEDTTPGRMKGFVIHCEGDVGGGEGSRDTQFMWTIVTTGFDWSFFVV